MLVSHDRYLVRGLATQIWVIEPGSGKLELFAEGYESYIAAKKLKEKGAQKASVKQNQRNKRRSRTSSTIKKNNRAELESLEKNVEDLEQQLEYLAAEIQAASDAPDELQRLSVQYAALEDDLQRHLERWERLVEPDSGA